VTFRTLIRRSLRFHARAHVGVVLGAAIGSAALIGALLVGDSVRETLKERGLERLGGIHFALSTPDRLFESAWARDWPLTGPLVGPSGRQALMGAKSLALLLPGLAARQDGSARANGINVIGVDPSWEVSASRSLPARMSGTVAGGSFKAWQFRSGQWLPAQMQSALTNGAALVNETLSRQLAVRPGDEIIVRVRKPSALGLDAALSPRDESAVALRLKVGAILPADELGDFALTAQPAPPMNLFVSRGSLARQMGVGDGANLLALGPVLEARKLGRLGEQRDKLADWLMQWAPLIPLKMGTPRAGSQRDPASLAGRMAGLVRPGWGLPVPDPLALPWLQAWLDRGWLPEYTGVSVRAIEGTQTATGGEDVRPWIEVASSRIFLEPPVVAAALKPSTALLTDRPAFSNDTTKDLAACQFVTNGLGVLTYLANAIRAGDRLTPYSMVTAAGGPFVPAGMSDQEILVNEWLAEDLQVKPGDTVALSYYVADSGSRLAERTNSFRVRAIVPIRGIYADRTLMPEFPGLAKAESTRDWDAGFPLVHRIRDKDEAYWKKYRGTPKAFITLAAGQALWANRFGSLTAIRYQAPANSVASSYREAVYRNLVANLNPADLGFRFEPVREQALKAAGQSQDFGQLFLGFSFFLVLAALLLMALLFEFGLEQRAAEVGTLLALGFTAKQVRRLLLAEGAALAFLGGVLGALGGLAYARAMLWGLATAWRNAVGAASLHFHASLPSLVAGLGSSTLVAALAIWLTLRKQARQPIRDLLEATVHSPKSEVRSPKSPTFNFQLSAFKFQSVLRPLPSALLTGGAAAVIVGWALMAGQRANAGAFFGAGALLLASGLAWLGVWLRALARPGRAARLTVSSLGARSCARRPGRSLATVALLASGCFVVAAVGVFRLDASRDATRRDSGTGGFALLGESTLPVAQDLNTKAGLEAFGLEPRDLAGARVVPLRLHQGDEASCLNLNRAQQPRLLGVNPELLAGRFTFAAAATGCDRRLGWNLLNQPKAGGPGRPQPEIPAIGDANSIEWALGKELGETVDYRDEEGRTFKVKLVGAVANSILQGSLIIDEAEFVKRFPNESGYRMFLIDAPSNSVRQVSAGLSRALQDVGLELTPTAERLNEFNAVQNTYLGTFQVLGGLGLLLGSAGLGVVVLRNVLERRGELGLLAAVGFRRRTLQAMVLSEHGALLALGLGLGILAAAVAVLPSLFAPGALLPYRSLALTLGAVSLDGALCTWLATRYSLRGNLLDALRNE